MRGDSVFDRFILLRLMEVMVLRWLYLILVQLYGFEFEWFQLIRQLLELLRDDLNLRRVCFFLFSDVIEMKEKEERIMKYIIVVVLFIFLRFCEEKIEFDVCFSFYVFG